VQNPCRGNQRVLVDTALVASANSLLNLPNSNEDQRGGRRTGAGRRRSTVIERLIQSLQIDFQSVEVMIQTVEDSLDRATASYEAGVYQLKAATITCLLALLECVDEPYIPGRMLETLGHQPLRVNMNNLLLKYNPDLVPPPLSPPSLTRPPVSPPPLTRPSCA